MAGTPSLARQFAMLERLLANGLIIARGDHSVLRQLQHLRFGRALPLYDTRGKISPWRAWQITAAGTAAALGVKSPGRHQVSATPEAEQIDLEEAIASSGERPVSPPLTDPDAPAVPAAGGSAPEGRSSRRSARGRQPEHATP